MPVRLTGIHVYPLKAAAGLALSSAMAGKRGLAHDRRWMVVDRDGLFLSQRQHPQLARIRTQLDAGGGLILHAANMPALVVPVPTRDAVRRQVQIWRDRLEATCAGDRADLWLSRFLKTECALVFLPDDVQRPLAFPHAQPGEHVSLADGFPYLLIAEESLTDLNDRLTARDPANPPVPPDRFRPNLVVSGADAFAEDGWHRLRIADVVFRLAKPCSRCSVITVDQQTGRCGSEPLRTLATYRLRDGEVWFGVNLVAETTGWLRCGDIVEVLN